MSGITQAVYIIFAIIEDIAFKVLLALSLLTLIWISIKAFLDRKPKKARTNIIFSLVIFYILFCVVLYYGDLAMK